MLTKTTNINAFATYRNGDLVGCQDESLTTNKCFELKPMNTRSIQ